MNTTLAERIKEAMNGPPKVSGVELAAACGIAPPSVSDWRSGKSKTIEGSNLLAAAHKLNVRPQWLANGTGPKRPEPESANLTISDNLISYQVKPPKDDPWITEAVKILRLLSPAQREGAVASLRVFVSQLGPPRNGQTLPMAVKQEGAAKDTKKHRPRTAAI